MVFALICSTAHRISTSWSDQRECIRHSIAYGSTYTHIHQKHIAVTNRTIIRGAAVAIVQHGTVDTSTADAGIRLQSTK
jgi:hypothetical protein